MKHPRVLLLAVLLWVAPAVIADNPLNGGDPNCDGSNTVSDLTFMVNFLFKGGAAPCEVSPIGAPIAGGFVQSDGSIISGSPNFTCVWNATGRRYEITISGHNYVWNQFITVATGSYFVETGTHPGLPITGSAGGKLLLWFKDIGTGNYEQMDFQFITYSPGVLMASPEMVTPEPVTAPADPAQPAP